MLRPWPTLLEGGWRRGSKVLLCFSGVSSARRRRRGIFHAQPLKEQSRMRAQSPLRVLGSTLLRRLVCLRALDRRAHCFWRRHLNSVALAYPQRSRSALYCSRQDTRRTRGKEIHHSPRTRRQNKSPQKQLITSTKPRWRTSGASRSVFPPIQIACAREQTRPRARADETPRVDFAPPR